LGLRPLLDVASPETPSSVETDASSAASPPAGGSLASASLGANASAASSNGTGTNRRDVDESDLVTGTSSVCSVAGLDWPGACDYRLRRVRAGIQSAGCRTRRAALPKLQRIHAITSASADDWCRARKTASRC